MTATQTETIGLARGEIDHLVKYRVILKPRGIDADEFIRVLTAKIDVATRANARQGAHNGGGEREGREGSREGGAEEDDHGDRGGLRGRLHPRLGLPGRHRGGPGEELPGGPGPPAPPQPDPAARG